MSPEQCKGKPIDRRSDIFALGICLYELTTLRRAYKGNDDFETMKRIVAGDCVLPSAVVPGYPRELEAIVLTAMANDVNARFQNGQEMIEALDAFAVRAKLTGSNTAMGRFMGQLFGSKREPWVDGGGSDRTQVSDPSDADPDNDEKTLLVERGQQLPNVHRAPTATTPGVGRSSGSTPAMPTSGVAAAEWQLDSHQGRQPTPRPALPFESRTPANGLSGPGPGMERMGSPSSLRPETEPGSKPLVDEKMGWQTGQSPLYAPAPDGSATTRFQDTNVRVVTSRGWILFVILMLAGLVAGIAIALHGS
jgi:serine/threonine-protein kinase